MSATFASFNSALSALRYNQVLMDTASGNIANVSTEGYARRRAVGQATGAPAVPAMWSRYEGSGDGVRVGSYERMVDPFLDSRARREHGNQAYLDTRQATLERVEAGLGEPGKNGFAAALDDFRQGWHDLANNPSSDAARSQVLSRANIAADALRTQSRNVATEEGDQRFRVLTDVAEVNTLAGDLAATNRSIAVAQANGTEAGTLLDKRDALAMRISELTGATATQRSDGGFDVSVNGVSLVSGANAGTFQIAAGVAPDGSADGNPVSFSIVGPGGGTTALTDPVRGQIGATADLLNVTLPAYRAGLDTIARNLADQVNAQHALGFDASGAAGTPLFSYDPADPAGSLSVAITDPADVAASSLGGGVVQGDNATAMEAAITVGGDYQRLVNGFGSEVASVSRLAANQQTLTEQVDASREQLSGVNLDEEMVSMLQAQHAYEAAARVMSTLDSVLDTLINRTGLGALMAISRVTQSMMTQRSLGGLQSSLSRLSEIQEQLSTGKVLNRPSDSPSDTMASMRMRSSIADQKQYARNADDGLGRLGQTESTLTSMNAEVRRARDLALTGVNGGLGQTSRDALAIEVDKIRESLIGSANTTYLGRPVFGGITAGTQAYDASGTYIGTPGAVNRTVAQGVTVDVQVDGQAAFGATGSSLFDDLTALSAALRAGDTTGMKAGATALTTGMDRIQGQISDIGARFNRLEQSSQAAADAELSLTTSLSEVENTDLPKATVELKMQEVAYQAALASTARVMQPSLLDFLR